MEGVPKNLCEIHRLGPATREWLVSHQHASGLAAATPISFAGFTDARSGYAFAFSNAFKREMGLPPSRHRARLNGRR